MGSEFGFRVQAKEAFDRSMQFCARAVPSVTPKRDPKKPQPHEFQTPGTSWTS